jgi:hypothetical protein
MIIRPSKLRSKLSKTLTSYLTYPLSVISSVSSVSGSALIAAQPPRMKKYSSWIEIFKDLYENVNF